MALMKWRPMADMTHFQEEVNRLFDDFFHRVPSRTGLLEGTWNPTVDVAENKDDVVVRVELPGVPQDDVKVSITDNVLTIRGEKKHHDKEEKGNYHRTECCYGSFQRSFRLPTTIHGDEAKATYKDGVLKVAIPKQAETKPKEVAVAVE